MKPNFKQKDAQTLLGRSQATVSLVLNGKIPISWDLADRLSVVFPDMDMREWKRSSNRTLIRHLNAHFDRKRRTARD